MRHLRSILIALFALFVVAGCANMENTNAASQNHVFEITSDKLPLNIAAELAPSSPGAGTDLAGNLIEITDATRVVTLSPGSSEILLALGFSDVLVGRDLTDNYPDLQDVPVVTDTHAANLEKILAVNPTLLIVDDNSRPISVLEDMQDFGVQVVKVPVANSLETAKARALAIANIFGLTQLPSSLVNAFESGQVTETGIRVAFLYLRGQAAVYLLGGAGSGADSLIKAAGGIDVGESANLPAFTPLTPEYLAELNPDVLLVMKAGLDSVGGADGIFELAGVAQTNAGKNRRVIAVDDSLLLSFGARSSNLVAELHKALLAVSKDD